MSTIGVTGATGGLGQHVVEALLRDVPASQIVAFARDVAKAAPLAERGVSVRHADYEQPHSLAGAFEGVDRLLLISGNDLTGRRFAQHRAVIDAAAAAGVSRLVYTSVLGAGTTSNPVAPDHVATEEYLASSGVPHAVLRNGWYSENYLPTLQSAPVSGEILTNAGAGRVASASRADFGEAAAAVLTATEVQRIYELSGDVAWSQQDLADAVSDVTGTEVKVHEVSAEEHVRLLEGVGLDAGTAGFVTAIDSAIAQGGLAQVTGELSGLIGRPTTPLVETLRAGV